MKTLKEQLEEKAAKSKSSASSEVFAQMKKAIDDLAATHIIENATKTGDHLPVTTLPNIKNELISLNKILETNKLIIVFYRGGWCPYCNLELQAYEQINAKIKAKGAKLVAISPDTPENATATINKHGLSFEVLVDKDNQVATQLGLVYKIPRELNKIYLDRGIDLNDSQGNNNLELPLAATYIVEKDGRISFAFLEEDYKKRAEPSEVLGKL